MEDLAWSELLPWASGKMQLKKSKQNVWRWHKEISRVGHLVE